MRYILLALCLVTLLASATPAHADAPILEPDYGNEFLCIQHALCAEMCNQVPLALLEGARVLHTKGGCYRDTHWLTTWGVALRQVYEYPESCIQSHACASYFLFYAIEPSVREPVAVAAYLALTEIPQVPRYHFDTASAPLAYWWASPLACPRGNWVIGSMRFC